MVEAVTGAFLLYRMINKDNPTTAFFGRIPAILLIEPPRQWPQGAIAEH
jgi:hypothetical protein